MAGSSSGSDFPGIDNLHNDIYPAISASVTPSLHQAGKVVLITGAGRGIGRAAALQFAHAQVSTIILCARTSTQLEEVAAAIRQISKEIKVLTYSVDVTNETAVNELASEITQIEGRLDVLVNNAGASERWVLLEDSNPQDWWNTFEINVKGPYLFTRAFLPLLVKTAADHAATVDVVNMSSIGAHVVVPTASAYQITKLALCRLTEFIHAEYAAKGVNAVAMHPGGVPTKMSSSIELIQKSKITIAQPFSILFYFFPFLAFISFPPSLHLHRTLSM